MSCAALVSVDSSDIWVSRVTPGRGRNLKLLTLAAVSSRRLLSLWIQWSWHVTLFPANQAWSSSQITSFCSFCQTVSSCDICLSLGSGLRGAGISLS